MSHTCQCGRNNSIDYTNESIRDVLLAGIYDIDIRRETLGIESSSLATVNDVIGFVEGKKMARDALLTSNNSSISSFKQTRVSRPRT